MFSQDWEFLHYMNPMKEGKGLQTASWKDHSMVSKTKSKKSIICI